MRPLNEIANLNTAAERREWNHHIRRLHELENILGLDKSYPTTWETLRRRVHHYESSCRPADDHLMKQPITLGGWLLDQFRLNQ